MAGTDLAPLFAKSGRRIVSTAESDFCGRLMARFTEKATWRNTLANQLEETAQLLWPEHRNTFFYGTWNWPGQKKTQQQVDASGMLALHRFAAIADSLLTPANSEWHGLEANNDYVMKDRRTRLYFDDLTAILHKYRKNPLANFRGQNNMNWRSLGGFGNATMYVDAFDGRHYHGFRGLRYRSVPFGETFYAENHQGIVDDIDRWFRVTARQAAQKWGESNLPEQLQAALTKNSEWPFNFLHCVHPRDDYDPGRYDYKGLPFTSYYLSIEGMCLLQPPGGYRTFPYAVSRYDQAPREVYGRGPAQMVLPALKSLNKMKMIFLKQGHRAADPVLLIADDGLASTMNLTPGFQNKGFMNQDGKPLVGVLPTGEIQIAKEMMAEERGIIDDMFLVTLYKVLSEHPNMTATQVIELVNEKGILVAPTLGRQETEYLGPMIEREIDVLNSQGLLPPMPPRLREAKGEYQVVYTSPLALSQRANEAAGFMQVVDWTKEIVAATGDPSHFDPFDFDTAIPEIAHIRNVPEHWMADENQMAGKRKARAKAQQADQQLKAMPALAAMKKADAVQFKAGMQQPNMTGPNMQPIQGAGQ